MSRPRVELIDTSILLEVVDVPGKAQNREEVLAEVDRRGSTGQLLLSLSSILETGNIVGQLANGYERRRCAEALSRLISATISNTAPWHFRAFHWDQDFLSGLINPDRDFVPELTESLATEYLSMGDLLIVQEFKRLRSALDAQFIDVDVWTTDGGLRGVIDSLRDS